MQKSTYVITKMDCPGEEQLIRMKLADIGSISDLNFDLQNRKLTVIHSGNHAAITASLESLNLDSTLINSEYTANQKSSTDNTNQKRALWWVLGINFIFFILELTTGFISNSMGLVADSLDMLADSFVYGLALFAVGGSIILKKRIAKTAGIIQLILAILGLSEVIRRFIGFEETPDFLTMILMSFLALIGNSVCLFILQKSKSQEAHMQASMIFTSNDVIVNFGVIIAGILVFLTGSIYPDLIVGIIVFLIVGNGAFRILKLSK